MSASCTSGSSSSTPAPGRCSAIPASSEPRTTSVARSASSDTPRRATAAVTAAAVLAAAGALAGCATTQQEAARLQLNAARIRASEQPTEVKVAGQTVDVTRVARVVTGGQTAFVVQVRNSGQR